MSQNQIKIPFCGDRLDPTFPALLQTRMKRDEWNAFGREINLAIRTTQMKMRFTPWLICGLTSVGVMIVLLEVALNFATAQAQILMILLLLVVSILLCVICRCNTHPPSVYCEAEVDRICQDYTDEERNLYFFYRHHDFATCNPNALLITENRFYIEVFVGPGNDVPIEEDRTSTHEESVIWKDEHDDEEEDPPTSQELVPFGEGSTSQELVPFDDSNVHQASSSQELVPLDNSTSQELVHLDDSNVQETTSTTSAAAAAARAPNTLAAATQKQSRAGAIRSRKQQRENSSETESFMSGSSRSRRQSSRMDDSKSSQWTGSSGPQVFPKNVARSSTTEQPDLEDSSLGGHEVV